MTTDALPPASERRGVPGHDSALERQNAIRLLTLRTQGHTYAQIAEETGYADASGARQALLRALDRHEGESVRDMRAIENARLDSDEQVLRAIIDDTNQTPDVRRRAVDSRTRLAARRARLNGLDAPVEVALTSGVQAELEDALAAVEAAVRGEVVSVHDDTIRDTP